MIRNKSTNPVEAGLPAEASAEAGQTLIETIIGIFILTTALTAGLGVAIFVLSSSKTSDSQIIAANLAREGIEAVRMMRDSNWLAGDAAGGASDLQSCADLSGKFCYPRAFLGPAYNITAGSQRLNFDSLSKAWSLSAGSNNYNLYLQSDGSYNHNPNGSSNFARKITISNNTNSPYTAANPELIVHSIVGWTGKNCTIMVNQDPDTTNCRLVVEEHLTNWKDYK